MLNRLLAVLFLTVVSASSAMAQFVCSIANDFSGTLQSSPGNYTVTVNPNAVGSLVAQCSGGVSSYTWTPGNLTTQTISVTAPGTPGAQVSYTLTGCVSPLVGCAAPVTITLQVANPPVCQIANDFNGALQTFPGNYTVTVKPNVVGSLVAQCGGGVNSYNWSPGNAQTQGISVTTPGTPGAQVSYTLTGCISTGACAAPVTITLQVANPPVCQIANDFAGALQTFPGNYSVTVKPNAVGSLVAQCGGGVNSYNWSPGNAQTQGITVTTPSTPGAQVSYTLTGCISGTGTCAPPVTITLQVAQPTGPDCTLQASPNPAVSGQTVTFTGTCTPPAAEIQYTDFAGNSKSTTSLTFTEIAPVVSQPTVFTIRYHGVGVNSEAGPEKTINVTVNPGPAVPPPQNCTLTATPNPVTVGNPFTLTAACTAGAAVSSYFFVGPNGATIASGPSNTVVVPTTTPGTFSYTARMSNAGGEASASTSVVVLPLAPAGCTLTGNPNPIVLGQQTVLTATCAGGGTPTTFAFTYPDGSVVSGPSNTLAVTPPTVGNHAFTVVASNAGGSAPPASFTINVAQAVCTIAASVANPVFRNTPVTLTAACNNSPIAFQWSTPSGSLPNAGASITVTPAVTTTYTVNATNASSISPIAATGSYTVVVSNAAAIANIVSGAITGLPGRPLARALEVRVTDQSGNPVATELVNWSVVNPGPNPGTFGSNPSPRTNAQGVTTNTFTMGTDPRGRTLRACLAVSPTTCADFVVVAGATQITAVAGGPVVGAPGRPLSRDLAVQVRDAQGNTVAGESVAWSVVNGGSDPGTFAVNPSAPTDAQGITRNSFTMGTDPGGRALRACLVSLPTVCADFAISSVQDAVIRPATKIMQPMSEVALATPLTQIHNIRLHLEQLRLRRNPSVVEALRVSVAGRPLPPFSAFALAPRDKDGKPIPQRGGGAAAEPDPFERLGFFVNGDVEIGKQSSTGLQNGFELNTKGVTFGADYRLPGTSVIGLAAGFMKSDADLADAGGSQDANGYSFSAYGSFVPATGAYVDVIAHGGSNKYDTRRVEPAGGGTTAEYTSNTRGNQFAFAVTAGADFNSGPVTMNPYLRLDYVDAKIDGFTESGDGGSIVIRDLDLRQTVITLGGQLSYAMSMSWGVLMPNARLELQRRVQGDGRMVNAALLADSTINAAAPLEPMDRNYGNVSIGASAVLPKGVSGFFNYERLFGRDSYSNSKYTVGVRFEF